MLSLFDSGSGAGLEHFHQSCQCSSPLLASETTARDTPARRQRRCKSWPAPKQSAAARNPTQDSPPVHRTPRRWHDHDWSDTVSSHIDDGLVTIYTALVRSVREDGRQCLAVNHEGAMANRKQSRARTAPAKAAEGRRTPRRFALARAPDNMGIGDGHRFAFKRSSAPLLHRATMDIIGRCRGCAGPNQF